MIALMLAAALATQQFDLVCKGDSTPWHAGSSKEYAVDLSRPAMAYINDTGVGPPLDATVTATSIRLSQSWGGVEVNRATGDLTEFDGTGRPIWLATCSPAPFRPMAATKF